MYSLSDMSPSVKRAKLNRHASFDTYVEVDTEALSRSERSRDTYAEVDIKVLHRSEQSCSRRSSPNPIFRPGSLGSNDIRESYLEEEESFPDAWVPPVNISILDNRDSNFESITSQDHSAPVEKISLQTFPDSDCSDCPRESEECCEDWIQTKSRTRTNNARTMMATDWNRMIVKGRKHVLSDLHSVLKFLAIMCVIWGVAMLSQARSSGHSPVQTQTAGLGTCSVSEYGTKSTCEAAGHVWTPDSQPRTSNAAQMSPSFRSGY